MNDDDQLTPEQNAARRMFVEGTQAETKALMAAAGEYNKALKKIALESDDEAVLHRGKAICVGTFLGLLIKHIKRVSPDTQERIDLLAVCSAGLKTEANRLAAMPVQMSAEVH